MIRRPLLPAAVATAVLALGGCGAFSDDVGPASGEATGPLPVLTSAYPLQFLTERVGGDRVEVGSLTPSNVDPHTVELAPRTVAEMEGAALVVHVSGFQPAVDEAVSVTGAPAFDAADHTELLTATQTGHDHGDEGHDEHGHADHTDAHDGAGEHEDDAGSAHGPDADGGPLDPHFWLDPIRLAEVGLALAEELAAADPDGAAAYRANAEELHAELTTLAEEIGTGLATCERDTIVVAHEAYGYLTAPHGIRQEGLSGIDPEAEPSPARLAQVAAVVAEHDVDTVFVEALLSPAVSEAFAADLGLRTAVLDPLENQQDESADYLDVMRANLAALQEALGCVTS